MRIARVTHILCHGLGGLRLALVCVVGLGVLTACVALGVAVPGDAELVYLAVSARSGILTQVIWLLTFVSSSVPALLITLVVSAIELRRTRRLQAGAIWASLVFLGNAACNIALRMVVGRQRPPVAYIPHLLPEVQADFQRFSYPSGHAGAALLAFSALVVLVWPHVVWRRLALAVALFVVAGTGFGRVYLGVHWPTDVLGGYLLAGSWLGVGLYLQEWAKCSNGWRMTMPGN